MVGRAGLVARYANGVVVGAAMESPKGAASVRVIEASGFRYLNLCRLRRDYSRLHHLFILSC